MGLSSDIIAQFVKMTNDNKSNKKETSTVYGTVTSVGNVKYVQFDGSETSTPVSSTVDVKEGDRVIVTIKNHSATITGNLNDPSASSKVVDGINIDVDEFNKKANSNAQKITDLEILVADRVTTEQLNAVKVNVTDEMIARDVVVQDTLKASIVEVEGKLAAKDVEISGKVEASEGEIEKLKTNKLDVEAATATYATIKNLEVTNEKVNNLEATHAELKEATIDELSADYAFVKDLEVKYANIDFTNIGKAAIEEFFTKSGMIENVVVGDGSITGVLVGVTIKGDLIEGSTVVAEKLVIRGEDGLYYKLNTDGVKTEAEQTDYNSLNGSIITAKSITATKISVDDLVAFGATIGGYHITSEAIYSGVKESIDNPAQGVYMDSEGQISLGDGDNYLRYFRDEDGNWKLEISAESVLFGGSSKSSAEDIKALTEHVKVGTYNDPVTGETKPCVELSEGDSEFKQVITNTSTMFMDGSMVRTEMNTDGVTTENATIKNELRQGGFVWKVRPNGNLGLTWKGGNS